MPYKFDHHEYAYRRIVATLGVPLGGPREHELLQPLAAAASRADFTRIATRDARPVSGRFLREVLEARLWAADSDATTFHGADFLALYLDRDRTHWGRAEAILRNHGWLLELGKVGRARAYSVEVGNTDPVSCVCQPRHSRKE
jgi:hypothetical protein